MTTAQIVEIMTSKAAREIKSLRSFCTNSWFDFVRVFHSLLTLMHMKKEITTKTYDYCLDILSQALTERGKHEQ